MKILVFLVMLFQFLYSDDFIVSNIEDLVEKINLSSNNGKNDIIYMESKEYNFSNINDTIDIDMKDGKNLTIIGEYNEEGNKPILNSNNYPIPFFNIKDNNSLIIMENLIFTNSYQVSNSGIIFSNSDLIIKKSEFLNNNGENNGSSIYFNNSEKTLYVFNTLFKENTSDKGASIYTKGTNFIINSIFINNSSSIDGSSIYSIGGFNKTVIVNSNFNNNGKNIYSDLNVDIYNSIFNDNSGYNVKSDNDMKIYNSFLNIYDLTKIKYQNNFVESNNIFDSFIIFNNENLIIDNDNNDNLENNGFDILQIIENYFIKEEIKNNILIDIKKDFLLKKRTVSNIDIGAFEFNSYFTAPTLNNVTYNSDNFYKIYSNFNFDFNFETIDNKKIKEFKLNIEDIYGNLVYLTSDKNDIVYSFDSFGDFELKAIIIDEDNEIDNHIFNISVYDLSENEKKEKIESEYLEYIKNNLSEFNLTTLEDKTIASENKFIEGKSYVLNNLSEFNLTTVNINNQYLENLENDWHLIGTSEEINDLSIFDDIYILWIYNNGAFKPYTSNQYLLDKYDLNLINYIPKNSGIWIKKVEK